MRPVYHKLDTGCLAHLHLAVLAYWVVVSIRHMLAAEGIHHEWRFIVETMDSQQSVHSTMENLDGETVVTELCSEPEEKVTEIYQCTKIDSLPYKPVLSINLWKKKLLIFLPTLPTPILNLFNASWLCGVGSV